MDLGVGVIIGIDPGPRESAVVTFDARVGPCEWFTKPNEDVRSWLSDYPAVTGDIVVIEQIAAMGMAVGETTFETVFWSGRFAEAWAKEFTRIKRVPIKVHLCGVARAKDGNVRRALMDRFGGDRCHRKGGPLYKLAGDQWSALAVAVTYFDLNLAPKPVPERIS